MYDKLVSQSSLSSYYTQEDSILSNIETMFSESETSGFSVTLSNFMDSVESLRSDSTNLVYKNELSTQGQLLVDGLQSLNSSIDEEISDTKSLLEDQVDSVNNILKQIVDLNKRL